MATYNQWIGLGNLTREPETKYTQGGLCLCSFGLAVNEKRTGKPDVVLFVDVTLFDKKAEVASQYLHKGSQVIITGKLVLDQWEQDGQKRSKHKINGTDFQMIGGKRGDETSQVPAEDGDEYSQAPPRRTAMQPVGAPSSPPSDDIPF